MLFTSPLMDFRVNGERRLVQFVDKGHGCIYKLRLFGTVVSQWHAYSSEGSSFQSENGLWWELQLSSLPKKKFYTDFDAWRGCRLYDFQSMTCHLHRDHSCEKFIFELVVMSSFHNVVIHRFHSIQHEEWFFFPFLKARLPPPSLHYFSLFVCCSVVVVSVCVCWCMCVLIWSFV
jgi:hypothetical protein